MPDTVLQGEERAGIIAEINVYCGVLVRAVVFPVHKPLVERGQLVASNKQTSSGEAVSKYASFPWLAGGSPCLGSYFGFG
jgi:hypothetical protein